ncbi:hypothetical protein [Zoogloea sp.]|uniref:hypothetical protein n=1 Tax=Zoogloea sp. TaxID=49181 RepID=UPI0037DA0FBC
MNIPKTIDGIDDDLKNTGAADDLTFDAAEFAGLSHEIFLESALLQWILTRIRRSPSRKIRFSGTDANDFDLTMKLGVSAPGLLTVLLPNVSIDQIGKQASAQFKRNFFSIQEALPQLPIMSSVFLACLDSYSRGLPSQLYESSADPVVVDSPDFYKYISSVIASLSPEGEAIRGIRSLVPAIAIVVYELFKNTHDHARRSVDGAILRDSMRGIYIRHYSKDEILRRGIAENPEASGAINSFVSATFNSKKRSTRSGEIENSYSGFLELSIFDSGPGLAATWLKDEISKPDPQAQYDAVLRCFGKGISSDSAIGRGYGLWKVLQELRKLKGLIRVRTNRVHCVRHFAVLSELGLQVMSDGSQKPKEDLYDWKRQLTKRASDYPAVEGTLVSILIPLEAM